MTWIQTLDGAAFDLRHPHAGMINPETIAICLARTCRFKGHCRDFYSVAQHSVIVESLIHDDSLRLPALLHDAHEVYDGFGDVARPAKLINSHTKEFLCRHQKRVDIQIARRFGFNPELLWHEQIKWADAVALSTERRDIMGPCDRSWETLPDPSPVITIEPADIDEAYRMFSARLYELWGE